MMWLQDYFNLRLVLEYADVFAQGIWQTLWISAVCLVLSLVLGMGLALARASRNPRFRARKVQTKRFRACRLPP